MRTILLLVLLCGGAAWAEYHAFSEPEATVRHVYRWVCKPAKDKKLKGMFFAQTEVGDLKAHEGDFTDEFLKAMRNGFKAGSYDFDFLSCLMTQLPVRAPMVGMATVKGDTAIVPVGLTMDYRNLTREQEIRVELKRVGGVWKVSNVRNTEGFDVLKALAK